MRILILGLTMCRVSWKNSRDQSKRNNSLDMFKRSIFLITSHLYTSKPYDPVYLYNRK